MVAKELCTQCGLNPSTVTKKPFYGGTLSAVQLFGRLAVLETHTL